jgi:hypothetical protein
MIVFSGWTMIRESYSESGSDEKLLDDIIKKIRKRIGELMGTNECYDLRPLNGLYHLTIKAQHNHRDEQIIDFFKWIAEISVGSFGLLYVLDDEDIKRNNDNKFKVWRMKKGQVDELDDPFLSPFNPTIED